MEESFELPVTYKGQELLFPAQLKQLGYTHQFVVTIYDQEAFFEPDEEQQYRAMLDPEAVQGNQKIDTGLLQAIAESIQEILK